MDNETIIGMTKEETRVVEPRDTAEAMGSGDLPVYATPALVAFMEHTAKELVKPLLGPSETTVGTRMDIRHLKATKVGHVVRTRASLTGADGRKLQFRIEAFQGDTLIGEAEHERYRVDIQKFMEKISD